MTRRSTLGMVLLWPFTSLHEVPRVGNHWIYLVSLGVVHTCIMYILMYSAFQKLDTTKIAVLVGSLRKESINRRLARALRSTRFLHHTHDEADQC